MHIIYSDIDGPPYRILNFKQCESVLETAQSKRFLRMAYQKNVIFSAKL